MVDSCDKLYNGQIVQRSSEPVISASCGRHSSQTGSFQLLKGSADATVFKPFDAIEMLYRSNGFKPLVCRKHAESNDFHMNHPLFVPIEMNANFEDKREPVESRLAREYKNLATRI